MSPESAAILAELPARPILHPGQALDCYLEHLADANYLSAGTFMATVTAASDTTRYLLLRPTPRALTVLRGLSGQRVDALTGATLAPLDGTVVDLSGLDPHNQYSYRDLAARGWAPGQGTQICPTCLAENGTWDIAWRLPTTTVCLHHRTYLRATCPGCSRPFRATRSTMLRPVGATTRCGNALGRRGHYCRTDLASLATEPADLDCIERQAATEPRRLSAAPPQVFGEATTARQFLDDVKSLTALLLHIATATTVPGLLPRWAIHINTESHAQARAPRWGLRPPADIPTRSRALSTATLILTSADLESALLRFTPWVEAIPSTAEGLLGWAGDHTRHTGATTRLVMAAHAPRRRLSGLLHGSAAAVTASTRQIPQLLPPELYEAHLAGLFTSRPETIRLFTSLTMARTHPGIAAWADAARKLELPADLGRRCAAAAAASQTASPMAVVSAVRAAALDLDRRDYRALEGRVRALASSDAWFSTWARRYRPGTRTTTQPLALQWLWTHVSHAHPGTAPEASPTRARRFATTLTAEQQQALRQVLDEPTPPRNPETS